MRLSSRKNFFLVRALLDSLHQNRHSTHRNALCMAGCYIRRCKMRQLCGCSSTEIWSMDAGIRPLHSGGLILLWRGGVPDHCLLGAVAGLFICLPDCPSFVFTLVPTHFVWDPECSEINGEPENGTKSPPPPPPPRPRPRQIMRLCHGCGGSLSFRVVIR